MSLTLLQICTQALDDVTGFDSPSSIIGNDDDTAKTLLACARRTCRELEREVKWQALVMPYSFATVASTSAYSLPADLRRFGNGTFYNLTEEQALLGPVSGMTWAELTRGSLEIGYQYAFTVRGGYLSLSPTPSSVQNIGYDYYSKYFCTNSGGTAISDWTADSDLFRLDDELAVLGIAYRFKARKGLPFAEEKADYQAAVMALKVDDRPLPMIDVSGVPRYVQSNIPSRSWG
jgi:hypothetical protein